MYSLNNNVTYFDSFGVEHIPKEIKTLIDKSTVITIIFRIQAYDLIICIYLCIGFNNFVIPSKILRDCTNLFYQIIKKNDDMILNYC